MVGTQSGRDSTLDVLRSAAMLYIIAVWHVGDYAIGLPFKNSYTGFLKACFLGLFVFLSGMLLSRRYVIASGSDARRFYLHRVARIYPMYVLTLFGFLAAGLVTGRQLLQGLAGLNVLMGTPTQTLWFVEMLCIFYALAPLFLLRYTARRALVMGLALTLGLQLASCLTHGSVDVRLGQYVSIFAIAIIAGRASRIERVLIATPTVMCSVMALPALLWLGKHVASGVAVLVSQVAILAFVLPAFVTARWTSRWLSPAVPRNVAYASYAMYLLHRLTARWLLAICHPTSLWLLLLYLYGLWLPFTYVLARVFQRGYDLFCDVLLSRMPDLGEAH